MRTYILSCVVLLLLFMGSGALGQEESSDAVRLKAWILDYLTSIRTVQCEYSYEVQIYNHGSSKEHYKLKARDGDYWLENVIDESISMGDIQPGEKFTTNYLAGEGKMIAETAGEAIAAEINLKGPKIPEHLLGPRLIMGRGGHNVSLLEILEAPGYAKVFYLGSTTVLSYRRHFKKREQLASVDVYISDDKLVQIDWCFRPLCPMVDDLRKSEPDFSLRTLERTIWLSDYVTLGGVSFPCSLHAMTYKVEWGNNFAQMVALNEQGKISDCDYDTAIMAEAKAVPTSEESVRIDAASLKINEDIPDSALEIEIPKNVTVVDRADDTVRVPPPSLWAAYSDLILLAAGMCVLTVLLTGVWAWRRWR